MNKKKAFTLTELLVVVIVLGVLAAVAVPKFSRVLETRRTTEAENMLSAVRMEQEKRCTLGKKYTGDFADISTVAYAKTGVAEAKSSNYTYKLTTVGVEANRADSNYTLKIPSYKSGELCCSGEGCEALNKSYPDCATITVASDECAADACDLTPNTCACSTYASRHGCECSPSVENCCAAGSGAVSYTNGQCVCPSDQTYSGSKCVDICDEDEYWDAGSSSCKDVCSEDQVWNSTTKQCDARCTGGATWNGSECECPSGQKYVNGACENICSEDQVWNSSTQQCDDRCSGGATWNGSECVCAAGQEYVDGACKDICTGGATWNGSECVCAAGQEYIDGECVSTCGEGATFQNGVCVCDDPSQKYDTTQGQCVNLCLAFETFKTSGNKKYCCASVPSSERDVGNAPTCTTTGGNRPTDIRVTTCVSPIYRVLTMPSSAFSRPQCTPSTNGQEMYKSYRCSNDGGGCKTCENEEGCWGAPCENGCNYGTINPGNIGGGTGGNRYPTFLGSAGQNSSINFVTARSVLWDPFAGFANNDMMLAAGGSTPCNDAATSINEVCPSGYSCDRSQRPPMCVKSERPADDPGWSTGGNGGIENTFVWVETTYTCSCRQVS